MATHLIAFSSSLRDDARRPPSTQCAHSASLNPASVLLECICIPPHVRGVCLRLAHRQGRRERLRVGSWWASRGIQSSGFLTSVVELLDGRVVAGVDDLTYLKHHTTT